MHAKRDMHMACNQCGGVMEITEQNGGTNGGSFFELYECVNCGATGTIAGESSNPPQSWERSGAIFGD